MNENEGNADKQRGVIINTASIAAYEGQIGELDASFLYSELRHTVLNTDVQFTISCLHLHHAVEMGKCQNEIICN